MLKKNLLLILLITLTLRAVAQKHYVSFSHVAITVSNVDKSAEFYGHLFHLSRIKNPWPGKRIIWLSLGGNIALHLIEAKKEQVTVSKDNHIAFSTASINDFIAKLKKENIPFDDGDGKVRAINKRPDGVQQIYFKDPDGYLVEVNDAR